MKNNSAKKTKPIQQKKQTNTAKKQINSEIRKKWVNYFQ